MFHLSDRRLDSILGTPRWGVPLIRATLVFAVLAATCLRPGDAAPPGGPAALPGDPDGGSETTPSGPAGPEQDREQPPAESQTMEDALRDLSNDQLSHWVESEASFAQRFGRSRDEVRSALMNEFARRLRGQAPNRGEDGPEAKRQTPPPASVSQPVGEVDEDLPSQEPLDADGRGPRNAIEDESLAATPAVDQPVEVTLDSAAVQAYSGSPFGIAMLELQFKPGQGPIIYPDQPLLLQCNGDPLFYSAFDVRYESSERPLSWRADQVRAYGLFRNRPPKEIWIGGIDGLPSDFKTIDPVDDRSQRSELLRHWWQLFSRVPRHLDDEQKMLNRVLLDMLARRLSLPGPWPAATSDSSENQSELENQFERAVGMLFGIESVKLAMQDRVNLNQATRREPADRPLPNEPRLQSLVIPHFRQTVQIEPVANHVPEECFYLRTGNLANYLDVREFLVGWGGTLEDIVSTSSLKRDTRAKIESQLGLFLQDIDTETFDDLISDMALIGCDPLFQEGAAVGVLFHTRHRQALLDAIGQQRVKAKTQYPDATEKRVQVANQLCSFLSTGDNRLRSFYALDGEYHLLTNSSYLLNRFYEAGLGERSLGNLKEFQFAREKAVGHRDPFGFLYLSDPFFQRMVSPKFRIELTRRRHAAEELKSYQLARLIAEHEKLDGDPDQAIYREGILPEGFADRPDGSRPMFRQGRYVDSLRGVSGNFLPICDVPVDRVTASEVQAYQTFLRSYNRQWKRIDPVTVIFSRRDSAFAGRQRFDLEIIVAPYAQQRYAKLQRHLAPASSMRVAPLSGDLLSVDTAIQQSPGSPAHLLRIGLRDGQAPFQLVDGEIDLLNANKDESYAKGHTYAAMSPASTEMFRLLASVLLGRDFSQPDPQRVAPRRFFPPPSTPGQVFYSMGWALGNLTLGSDLIEILKQSGYLNSADGWMVFATDSKIRDQVLQRINRQRITNPTQVRLRMRSLEGSQVEPYIQAYTYVASRHKSAQNASFLNDYSRWFNLDPRVGRNELQQILGADVQCALGGEFVLRKSGAQPLWASTAWEVPSVYQVTSIPDHWRFAFLDWLRELHVAFDLGSSTLRAQINLTIKPQGQSGQWGLVRAAASTGDEANNGAVFAESRPDAESNRQRFLSVTSARAADPVTSQAVVPDASSWILGIRLAANDPNRVIKYVYPDSPAWRAGIRVGDRLRRVNWESAASVQQVEQIVRRSEDSGGLVILELERNGSKLVRHIRLAPAKP
ncbi:hypothetical protein FYK55_16435 [Roseiconus nitratireducens]|uniref:PDZ domain-containing protein n=1 Tax=Roseiconus nitratireducens TaxID=2605748 RepID=A0A5M6D2Q8_9BACT|nr:PDZ domain-containing protein [Roseiconus nitratireducens]KAA5541797.1 hypothetical protein FYK55_16435 [Roseiconus nitratireducens]